MLGYLGDKWMTEISILWKKWMNLQITEEKISWSIQHFMKDIHKLESIPRWVATSRLERRAGGRWLKEPELFSFGKRNFGETQTSPWTTWRAALQKKRCTDSVSPLRTDRRLKEGWKFWLDMGKMVLTAGLAENGDVLAAGSIQSELNDVVSSARCWGTFCAAWVVG